MGQPKPVAMFVQSLLVGVAIFNHIAVCLYNHGRGWDRGVQVICTDVTVRHASKGAETVGVGVNGEKGWSCKIVLQAGVRQGGRCPW